MSAVRDTVFLLLHPEWHRDRGPATVRTGKVMADNTEPVVVFLFGVRINRWRAIRRWLPLLLTVGTMLRELVADPDSGLYGYRLLFGPGLRQAMIVQYWRDTDDLFGFARRFDGRHRDAQRRHFRHYGATEAVGVWHEVMPSREGEYHGLYGNMPPTGMGALRPVHGREWWARGSNRS
jgi:hypothetical protein